MLIALQEGLPPSSCLTRELWFHIQVFGAAKSARVASGAPFLSECAPPAVERVIPRRCLGLSRCVVYWVETVLGLL